MSQKPPTRKKLNAQQRFLENYKRCGFVTVAAEASGIDPRRHREWLADPEYRQRFEQAEDIAVEQALAEVRRRGVEGWEEPVIYQGALCYPEAKDGKPSPKPLMIRKYDSNLLMFLVKGKRPEYRDSWKGELSVKGDINSTHNVVLSKLPDAKLDDLIHILEYAGDAAPAGRALETGADGAGAETEEPDS